MDQDKFSRLFNSVLSLLIDNKLREDIDDTLLEKLLNVLKESMTNESFIYDLQKNTKALILFDKALSDLVKENKELSSTITVFSLKLFGYFLQSKNCFLELKNSQVITDLANVAKCNIYLTCPPSIQDAFISALMSIAMHCEGALWLIGQDFIQLVISSYSSTSYYVKKTGSKFLATSVVLWSTSEFSVSCEECQKDILMKTIEDIVEQLIAGIQPPNDKRTENICSYCVSTLKQIFIGDAKLPNVHLPLIDAIFNYFKNMGERSKINQDVPELLLIVEKRYNSDITVIRNIMHVLVEKQRLIDAFHLASLFLSSDRYCRSFSKEKLCLFLMPYNILENNIPPNFEEEIFLLSSDKVHEILKEQMMFIVLGESILISSLTAVSKLTPFLEEQALESVLTSLEVIFLPEIKQKKGFHGMSVKSLEDRKIGLAFLELFSSFLSEKVYKCMNVRSKLLLFKYFIKILKNPSTDCNIVSEALLLLKSCIALNTQPTNLYSNYEIKNEIVELVCRKLFGNKEPIVESALRLAGEIIYGRDCRFWNEFVIKNSLHSILWDIAIESNHDGIIKATALAVLIETCSRPFYFDNLCRMKSLTKTGFMNILCNYVLSDDFFIQREALLCSSRWMQLNPYSLPLSCKKNLYFIFSTATRSLDLDLKLAALREWRCFIENDNFFPSLSKTNINMCLTEYCSTGFGSSMLYALEDYDEAVKYLAATMMLNLREKLLSNGITKDFISEETSVSENIPVSNVADSLSAISVSKEERDEGIDNVMKLSTADQMLSICKTTDLQPHSNIYFTVPELQLKTLSCSLKSFWSSLWSDSLSFIVEPHKESTSVFSDYSLSLLEDIISAEKTEHIILVNDTPDCY